MKDAPSSSSSPWARGPEAGEADIAGLQGAELKGVARCSLKTSGDEAEGKEGVARKVLGGFRKTTNRVILTAS